MIVCSRSLIERIVSATGGVKLVMVTLKLASGSWSTESIFEASSTFCCNAIRHNEMFPAELHVVLGDWNSSLTLAWGGLLGGVGGGGE